MCFTNTEKGESFRIAWLVRQMLLRGRYGSLFFFKDFIYLFYREIARERGNAAGEWEKKKQAPSGEARCETRSRNAGITP